MARLDEPMTRRCAAGWPRPTATRDFPIQNLPLGVFSPPAARAPRGGVAIGDQILDLAGAGRPGCSTARPRAPPRPRRRRRSTRSWRSARGPRRALRARLSELLAEGSRRRRSAGAVPAPAARLHDAPAGPIGDYTDFYVGIHHATNVGKLFRPDNPLLPNYKYVPIGYHGRASSVRASRRRRCAGRAASASRRTPTAPSFGPAERLDYELELGVWIGRGNELGEPIPIGEAAEHIAGFCLLNDWSARDIQAWEYQPLGPFLAKNFAHHDLALGRHAGGAGAVPHRAAAAPGGRSRAAALSLDEADQRERRARHRARSAAADRRACASRALPPHRLSLQQLRATCTGRVAQMVAHHTCNGCNLQPGDLLGTGTISAPDRGRAAAACSR